MRWLYRLVVEFYLLGIRLVAPFVSKARQWVDGRQHLFEALAEEIDGDRPLIWMHCASLGEFEQGRPVLEQIRTSYPDHFILLTFFSPSGYEIRKQYPLVDYVGYLPGDRPRAAARFVEQIRPDLAIFVKYEFWLFHLEALFERKVPVLLISAIFRPSQLFFKWYGGPFRSLLERFEHIFVQNQSSYDLLYAKGLRHLSLSGDTRVDRVAQLPKQASDDPLVKAFTADKKVFIAGSSWPEDEALICRWINELAPEDQYFIIAPHDISERHLQQIEQRLNVVSTRYSQGNLTASTRVLLIDNIGKLSTLYRYAQLAYIGGGFGAGIHNTLEPAAYGLPIIFGPRYHKFEEAQVLLRTGGAFSIRNFAELSDRLHQLSDTKEFQLAAQASLSYVRDQQGASLVILNYLKKILPPS